MKLRLLTLMLSMLMALTACSNIYTPLAKKDTDEAIYVDAIKLLNDQKYEQAVATFEKLSVGFFEDYEVREYYAGALAGRCGFDFKSYLDFMGTADFSTQPFFQVLMSQFSGRTVLPAYCTLAENQIKSIWTARLPSPSQQLFMVMLSMSKMGGYLRIKADLDGTNNLGDGAPDAGFNTCTNTPSTLTDDDMKEVVTGFSSMLLNIGGFLGGFSGSTGSAITAITNACALISPNPCATTDPANVDAGMIKSMREILATNQAHTMLQLGIGTCGAAVPIGTCCP